MTKQKQPGKVYYSILQGSRLLLADERNKKRLLDIIWDVQGTEGWPVYAFCVTDDCVYLIAETNGRHSLKRSLKKAADLFLQKCRDTLPCLPDVEPRFEPEIMGELNSLGEIAGCCRWIHRIPLEKKYVAELKDYWWSSYMTYIGCYQWNMVDCRILSLYFSADPGIARTRLERFHCLHNEITNS